MGLLWPWKKCSSPFDPSIFPDEVFFQLGRIQGKNKSISVSISYTWYEYIRRWPQRQTVLHPSVDCAIVSSFTCPGRWTVSHHRAQHTGVMQPCHPALFVVQDEVLAFIPNWTCCSKPSLRQMWHAPLSVTSSESPQAVPAAFHSTAVSVRTTMSKGCFTLQ